MTDVVCAALPKWRISFITRLKPSAPGERKWYANWAGRREVVCLEAVSYTHLDVYKRQAQYLRIEAQGLVLVVHVYAGQFDFHFVSPVLRLNRRGVVNERVTRM